jgi:hypothetical protein
VIAKSDITISNSRRVVVGSNPEPVAMSRSTPSHTASTWSTSWKASADSSYFPPRRTSRSSSK